MVEHDNKLFCPLSGLTGLAKEQERLQALSGLGLLEAETIPVFEEATQTAAHFLEFPICILGFVDRSLLRVRSAVGLSRLGLMNPLARDRQLPRSESFCTHVVEKQQVLAIGDALEHLDLAKSLLVEQYGIRAYLGAPLFDASGHCMGTIAVMDLSPRQFTIRELQFLELIARWSMSEFERNWLLKGRQIDRPVDLKQFNQSLYPIDTPATEQSTPTTGLPAIGQVKLEILTQLTQELRTPLTSVLGMASVVGREIYGPLTNKQKEYVEVIQHSGRYLLSLVNEISELGTLDLNQTELNPTPVDAEMLCQQVSNVLEEAASRREQEIRLSVEPDRSRVWILDKDKVKHLLYHLVLSVVRSSPNRSVVRLHLSHRNGGLNVAISVSHPLLGDGLLPADPRYPLLPVASSSNRLEQPESLMLPLANTQPLKLGLANSNSLVTPNSASGRLTQPSSCSHSRESLQLLLSCYMAQLQGGQVSIQGTPESGYRYVVSLPELKAVEQSI